MTLNTNGDYPIPAPAGAALYVDTENLRDPEYARQVVAAVAANWPGDRPLPWAAFPSTSAPTRRSCGGCGLRMRSPR